jgi:hypothetical protein
LLLHGFDIHQMANANRSRAHLICVNVDGQRLVYLLRSLPLT